MLEEIEASDARFSPSCDCRVGDGGREDALEAIGVEAGVDRRDSAGVPGCLSTTGSMILK